MTFIGHTKDSLWSIDLFRCKSVLLKSHWVLVSIGRINALFSLFHQEKKGIHDVCN